MQPTRKQEPRLLTSKLSKIAKWQWSELAGGLLILFSFAVQVQLVDPTRDDVKEAEKFLEETKTEVSLSAISIRLGTIEDRVMAVYAQEFDDRYPGGSAAFMDLANNELPNVAKLGVPMAESRLSIANSRHYAYSSIFYSLFVVGSLLLSAGKLGEFLSTQN